MPHLFRWAYLLSYALSFASLCALNASGAEPVASRALSSEARFWVEGANASTIARECDAILDRLESRYGRPKYWRAFPIRFLPNRGSGVAGYTSYARPNVEEVVIYQPFESSVGGVLDHELTHAFFFYYVNANFDLFFNEGLAQNSEYASRKRLREQVYRRCAKGEFLPLDSLYALNRYDSGLLIYTQSFSVVDLLLARGGSRWLGAFLRELNARPNDLDRALKRFYGYETLDALEQDWLDYVREGQNRMRVKAL